ncbi:uncharacterized protein YydD (DUF2326 family) [Mesoflavibacter sabulilitoris]|uniref:DUF2326 domain-containing protein n=1 Tax=Mesoflavibacter zeaxanthinifaciens subsp. sabulilitoris TaxID=1520893 RepID=A0A2T1N5U3_9FLAO|nr:DUF2326 domain-containing protein [Mesoflavibacter zeaxanthinifaciens]MBB3123435.1 uncharacterized protein YydD (DUF2326 family) [Mesoflavibacter zeaxanthinifaciens subsp. sabulilitoris]PSG86933.1 DUF2326 domain-containing protein [Mesoflavibacter zeaxanthinifaciens subsp. sabulilitoris]
MFLKLLKIENDKNVIREVPFHKGINLIVDETNTDNEQESGNNVGKTTAIRLIDFCLGGKGKNIYQDQEFKNKGNNIIENFLKNNNIIITLILKEDLDVDNSREITIRRNFLTRKDKIQEINGEQFNDENFKIKLKELIFDSDKPKPTFRQLIAKNIRDEKNRLVNAVKVLHFNTTADEYEPLYLFWLGIDLDDADKKQRLLSQKKIEENLQKRLRKESNLSQIEQSLTVINRTISDLEITKENFNINENYDGDLSSLNLIKSQINKISTEISQIEIRKELIEESKAELEKEYSNIDVYQIQFLYKEAKILNPSIQKSFEETLNFHNSMLLEKINFITEELPVLNESIILKRRELQELLINEEKFTTKLKKSGAVSELQTIITNLNVAYEKKGNLEELKRLWKNSMDKLDDISTQLSEIDKSITDKDGLIQERISEFNKYFSSISNKLYGEQFVMSSEKTEKGYELNITSISGNLGTGKKKGQIAAFDLAYIQFADSLDIESLHFIIHDQIETVHGNQILNLMTTIINEINCQYIAPVLRDKLPTDIDTSIYEVLKLSQENKLFKI